MAEEYFSSEQVIDRDDELAAFCALSNQVSAPRVLLIKDVPGTGKSELMKLFKHHASYERDPPLPAALIQLERGQDRFWLVDRIASQLIDWGLPLPTYSELNDKRRTEDYRPFGGPAPRSGDVDISVKAAVDRGTVGKGAIVAGIYDSNIYVLPDRGTGGWDEVARKACISAFLDDLDVACREQSVVILLDQYERKSDDIHTWLVGALRNRVFATSGGYFGLVLVFAGNHVPVSELKGILRDAFASVVCSIDRLSDWEDHHVREWLNRLAVSYHEEDIPFIRKRLSVGWTLSQIRHKIYEGLESNSEGAT